MTPIKAIIITEHTDTLLILKKFEEENNMIIKIIGEAFSLVDGLVLIKDQKPDLIFVDFIVENNVFSEILEQLEFSIPKLVFISKNDKMAVNAFKHNAIDFILKPIEFNTLIISVYKVIKRNEMERSYQSQNINNIDLINAVHQANDYIAIASLDKIELINMSEIIFCQANGKYTNFFLSNASTIMSSRNLGEYTALLDHNHFFRIHHSYIINLRHIAKISKKDGYFCELSDGTILPVAKRRQDDFNKFIKLKN
ncbi:LytR/AlgR family response regulator transcription factor [Flavobacterium sp.]|jgi:two-component system LytT family response regulator|uniref:LytR/AlgR family response regulator transcription factor n=1 Tax=Flavobacterium sp. TaxID=239 RepID=UPI0037C00622